MSHVDEYPDGLGRRRLTYHGSAAMLLCFNFLASVYCRRLWKCCQGQWSCVVSWECVHCQFSTQVRCLITLKLVTPKTESHCLSIFQGVGSNKSRVPFSAARNFLVKYYRSEGSLRPKHGWKYLSPLATCVICSQPRQHKHSVRYQHTRHGYLQLYGTGVSSVMVVGHRTRILVNACNKPGTWYEWWPLSEANIARG